MVLEYSCQHVLSFCTRSIVHMTVDAKIYYIIILVLSLLVLGLWQNLVNCPLLSSTPDTKSAADIGLNSESTTATQSPFKIICNHFQQTLKKPILILI